jgi:two-component system sensor histidine kinase KdpD
MVGNLLAITRIDASALEVRRDWIDLREIAERVLSAARKRGATQSLRQAIPVDLPLVRADAVLIEQALTNIVSNAMLYAPPNAQVTIDGVAAPQAVTLRVTDDGPGIPAELLPRVFDKFARQRHGDRREGTGLGLAIARGIVEAHLGSVSAESPVHDGHGTRIVMTLPIAERIA